MKQEEPQYLSLYNTIVSQICMGTYRKGDPLGTAEEMCQKYHVGITTIRRVRKLLQENQFISSSRGKRSPAVIFDPINSPHMEKGPLIGLFQKKSALADLYQSLPILMPPLVAEATAHYKQEEIPLLDSFLVRLIKSKQTGEHIIGIVAEYMDTILSALHNPLIMDFRRKTLLFQLTPFHLAKQAKFLEPALVSVHHYLTQIAETAKQKDFVLSFQLTQNLYLEVQERAEHFFNALPDTSEFEQQPFTWTAGKGDNYLYWKVVFEIVEKIDSGFYREQAFLPSIADLAAEYQLSEITVRSSLQILRQCGIVETANGIGTKVVSKSDWKDSLPFGQDFIKESAMRYLYTLQFLALICSKPAVLAADRITNLEIKEMGQYLINADEMDRARLGTARFLDLVILHSCNGMIKTVLIELRKMLYWGHCLYFFFFKSVYNKNIVDQQFIILDSLQTGDDAAFGHNLSKSFCQYYENTRNIIISEGVAKEEDIVILQEAYM